ncbi:type IV secretion system protein [Xanthomonas campestris pv. campestris]|jgi:type IV secretion system protein VirB8|uniref:virB8 family protein n=1 Tax=Xanthomonas campestris TaxID=339 RepID=UPI001F46A9BB|nr:type IV secretion system protein [Xanthomonas campestris]MCF8828554.1 type IV secretion system protein [Xanthomonas campestris pv. raphani]MDM7672484.1 type IV secretion system protein [Xanthomonas campestris pv. campestris]MDM7685223.1 type IV secretion system protein [Xanthomonas campestris pv. campestris]MDM7693443.1 type IV secretion system protein [Xanthomonas campestris pv. campestris]MDM7697623.1 type IV secretion system protein [Xanthomonas campestris pv. campestris]
MAKSTPIKAADFDRYLVESEGFERDWATEVRSSRRMAWRVAGAAVAFGLLGTLIGVFGMSQTPAPPGIVRVNNATGAVDYVGTMRDVEQSYGEQTDKYWINNFMLCRESYDWHTIQKCYDTVGLMGSPTVQAEYSKLYNDDDGRQVKLANRVRIIPHIISITPNLETHTATVRFTTQKVYDNGTKDPEERFVATLAYRYVYDAALTEEQRRVNLLGFQVTSYRVDAEF